MNIYDIIIALSKNRMSKHECDKIKRYFKKGVEWDILIGQLLFHKLYCRAYKHFIEQGWIDYIPPAMKRPWQREFELNQYKNNLRKNSFLNLLEELNYSNIHYCIIKGLPLEKDLFKDSVREFSDIDVLIHIRDFELADKILTELGYKRGVYNLGLNQIESDRKQDIFHIMNTHQTLPYLKLSDDPFFKVEVIDLQFELTLQKKQKYDIDIDMMLKNRIRVDIYKKDCCTLDIFDNFIMLCTHLYGEAILIQEIKKYKDLQMTKFSDIYEWLKKYYMQIDWDEKIEYIKTHGILKPVLFCIYILSIVYDSTYSKNIYAKIGKQDLGFLDEYRDEFFHVQQWKVPILDRIFKVNKKDMI